MDALATLPVFFKLAGKRAVLAGGTAPAVWKAELLSAAGASVDAYADEPCAEFLALAANPPGGAIRVIRRVWSPADLAGAAIAIGAIEEADEAGAFRDAARAAGVPVNVIDNPPFCDFQFGTIVSRSPLVIGISTDGAAPVFGQALRARIEALLPQGFQRWAQAAKDWRPAVQALGLDFRARRRFWEAFTDRALDDAAREPDPADLDHCRSILEDHHMAGRRAELLLVGAGPGDADALTLGAVRALQSADVVAHAEDCPAVLVGLARREALKLPLPPSGGLEVVRAQLQPGRRVAWLDRGHPEFCEVWSGRRAALDTAGVTITAIAGLGRCSACSPSCPGWVLG